MHGDDDGATTSLTTIVGNHLDLTFGLPVSQPVALWTISLGSGLIVELRPEL
jgi:hypothetical protein